jgi:hypothetical protein
MAVKYHYTSLQNHTISVVSATSASHVNDFALLLLLVSWARGAQRWMAYKDLLVITSCVNIGRLAQSCDVGHPGILIS